MKIYTTRTHYNGLEILINDIGYENILQILPCYCGGNEYFYTIIYKEKE